MTSRIEGHIIETAIKLFADRGYEGLTTRDLAQTAGVTEASIYRLFVNKDELFKKVLTAATEKAVDPARFLLLIYEGEGKLDKVALLSSALMSWYSSLSPHCARLFLQTYILKDWREMAYGNVNKITEILITTLQRGVTNQKATKDLAVAGRAVIFALLQFKMTYATQSGSANEENQLVSGIIEQWLHAHA